MSRSDDEYIDEDPRPSRRKRGGSKIIWVVLGLGGVFLLFACCCGGIAALFYAPGGIRESASRARSQNKMYEISLGLWNYHDEKGQFPPPYLKTKDGKPGLSWRVAILPYIDQESLYRQFKLDEPWDSPANRPLLDQMPRTYLLPGETASNVTHYRGFVGPGTLFDPNKKKIGKIDVKDGLSNTIAIVEAQTPVEWTKPDDLVFTPTTTIKPLLNWRGGKATIAMADGSARQIDESMTELNLRNLITIADGNVVDLP